MRVLQRREFVVLSTGLIAGLSGCLGQSESDQIELDYVDIVNWDEVGREVSVNIDWNDELVYEESITLGGVENGIAGENSPLRIENTWSDEPGTFTIQSNIDGEHEHTISTDTLFERITIDGDCIWLMGNIRSGVLAWSVGTCE